jgi:hypothetical protein
MVRRPGHHGSPVELARPLWPRAFARQTPDHCTQPNVHRRLTRSRTPQIFRTRTEAREKLSPLAACWTTELGGLNKFIHTWVYKDLNERGRIREESRRPGGAWPPQAGVRPIRQENKLLIPAPFSPVR